MAAQKQKLKGSQFTTPMGRLSFPSLFTPKPKYQKPEELEYVTDLLWDKNTDFKSYDAAIVACLNEKYGSKDKWPQRIVLPKIDQEALIEKAQEKGYGSDHLQAGAFYARFKTNAKVSKPTIVDYPKMNQVVDETKVYGGVYARISGTMKVNEIEGKDPITNKKITTVYVTAYMSGVQIVKDGEAFGGGRRSAEDMFGEAFDAGTDEFNL